MISGLLLEAQNKLLVVVLSTGMTLDPHPLTSFGKRLLAMDFGSRGKIFACSLFFFVFFNVEQRLSGNVQFGICNIGTSLKSQK